MTTNDDATSNTPNELDLAFIIDATGSMGSYIHAAQQVWTSVGRDFDVELRLYLNRICERLSKILLEVKNVY